MDSVFSAGRLFVDFQPIVESASGIEQLQALIRWRCRDGRDVYPQALIK